MSNFRLKMDLQLFAGEKTESATPKKRQESRKEGQVAKSQELAGAFILLFIFLFMYSFGGIFKKQLFRIYTESFNDYMLWPVTEKNIMVISIQLVYHALIVVAPIMLVAVVIAIVVNYMQVGFLLTGKPLMPKFSKLNPVEGFKKIFSLRSLMELLKTLLKLTLIGFIVFTTLWGKKADILSLAQTPLGGIFSFTAGIVVSLGIKIAAILVLLALFDYLYQRYEHEKSLKMSKQDIKDEYKTTEGNPLIKGKIKEKQRKLAMQRMMQEIPKADVIITNPTHFAVAIKYEAGKMDAPVVLAKGQDYVALKIREKAQELQITIMENKPLARALYEQVQIGESIPADLFQAVAEVLAYVYRMKGKAM